MHVVDVADDVERLVWQPSVVSSQLLRQIPLLTAKLGALGDEEQFAEASRTGVNGNSQTGRG